MKRLALALLLSSFAIGVALADPTCHDRAAEKKLAGAALTSFMKKCRVGCRDNLRHTSGRQETVGCGQDQLYQEVCEGRGWRLTIGLTQSTLSG